MLFKADLAEKIMRGEKTQTRRRRTGSNPTQTVGGWIDDPCRYKPGHTYAVQPGRGKKGICRILVTAVTPQAMCDMTIEDVQAEGFQSHQEFVNRWLAMYGKGSWLDPVWKIEFRLADA